MEETVSLKTLTADDFSRHVNTLFTFNDGGREWRLTLTSVSTLPSQHPGMRKPFSLIFTGPPDIILPQHIYHLDHPSMGRLDIFIVPIGRDAEGTQYEAVFS